MVETTKTNNIQPGGNGVWTDRIVERACVRACFLRRREFELGSREPSLEGELITPRLSHSTFLVISCRVFADQPVFVVLVVSQSPTQLFLNDIPVGAHVDSDHNGRRRL